MKLDRNIDAYPSDVAGRRDAILALLEERRYTTNELEVALGVPTGMLDSMLRMLARQGQIGRLTDWRWRLVSMTGGALRRVAKPDNPRSRSLKLAAPPTLDVCSCARCGKFFQLSVGASTLVCLSCDEPCGEITAHSAPAPVSTTRRIDGVEYEVMFDGRGETPDWPTAWGSSLTGCPVLRL